MDNHTRIVNIFKRFLALVKADRPPNFTGDRSEDGRYIGVQVGKEHMWQTEPTLAAQHDAHITQASNIMTQSFKPEHRAVVRDFMNSVASDPHRHLRLSPTEYGQAPRARHISALLNGKQNVHMHIQEHAGQPVVVFKAIRHGLEGDKDIPPDQAVVDTWVHKLGKKTRLYSREVRNKSDL